MDRRSRRGDRGATTVEYAGIAVVIVAIVGALLALATPLRSGASDVADKTYCRLATLLGGIGGCNPKDLPASIPTKCTTGSHNQTNGAGVTVIATVGGDSGYTLTQVRTLNPDGTITTTYQVKTQGKVGANYTLKGGASAEVDTGDAAGGGKKAGGGLKINVGGDAAWGNQYSFNNLDDAQRFIDDYQGSFGAFGQLVGAGPNGQKSDYTYFDLSGQVKASGELGPLEANASGAVTLGAERHANGDTKVKMALTVAGAAKLGIPLPDQVMSLVASGDAKAVVTATVTFDKDGQLTAINGTVVGTVTGQVDAGLNTGAVKGTPIGQNTKIKEITLPIVGEGPDGGHQWELGFNTDFTRPDGSVDHAALAALSDGLANFITNGQGLTPEQQQAVYDQLNNHSQITYNEYDVDKEEKKYGGKIEAFGINLGAEYRESTQDNSLVGSYYYDPVLGSWQENSVCKT